MERRIAKVIKCNTDRSFTINGFQGDNKFETLQEYLSPYPLHIVAADKHVRMVERSSRTMKERTRYTCQNLLYLKIPKIMIDNLLELVISMLNAFPAKDGVSKTLSLLEPQK